MKLELGKNIKFYRSEKKWTQEELARKLRISRQTISKWELGKSYPDIENLIYLSKLFKISLDELVGLKPKREKKTFFQWIVFKPKRSRTTMKWYSGGHDRREEALVLIAELVSTTTTTEQEALKIILIKFYQELIEQDQSIPFILSRMNLELSNTIRKNSILLTENQSSKVKKLTSLSAIRYGY